MALEEPVVEPLAAGPGETFESIEPIVFQPVRVRRVSTLRVPPKAAYAHKKHERYVPFIRISGDWLDLMGFPQGGEFSLAMPRPGVLVLSSEMLETVDVGPESADC